MLIFVHEPLVAFPDHNPTCAHVILHKIEIESSGLEICGILVANATMFSHLLPGFSCGT